MESRVQMQKVSQIRSQTGYNSVEEDMSSGSFCYHWLITLFRCKPVNHGSNFVC
ncbi:hypothetical protein RchiOBHm_Chr2g0085851 [Rosa chinensis]|uniref:Uncharacterized protein n=1 Tax=Rosa chinensis TaxID=74649 RepID=A0A2P6RI83_ROSCH|nr:hypothetical protein RchiOBHm_Chr2g0085851 [Rosa chinensis]